MKIEKHVQHSIKDLRTRRIDFYLKNKKELDRLVLEIHTWMDRFANTRTEDYDYTGVDIMKHRERNHHIQGVNEAIDYFIERYGNRYRMIIFEETRRHVMDDLGEIPDESFYHEIGVWKRLRGF